MAAAEVGVLPPPDEEVPPPVVLLLAFGAVGVPAVGVVTAAGAAAAGEDAVAAGAALVVELAKLPKLGTNSKAFTFSLENFVLISLESAS